jgi:hypothetical protein
VKKLFVAAVATAALVGPMAGVTWATNSIGDGILCYQSQGNGGNVHYYDGLDKCPKNWSPVPMKAGPQGPKGDKGDKGEPGKDGVDGKDGAPGLPGKDGADGAPGEKGDQGPAGPQGEVGPQGPQGEKGDTGEQGPAGADGKDGVDGINGVDGAVGPQGPVGPAGEDGANGKDGVTKTVIVENGQESEVPSLPDTGADSDAYAGAILLGLFLIAGGTAAVWFYRNR